MAEHNFSVENTLTLLLDDKKYHSLRDILSTMNPADIAAVFDELPESRLPLLFRLLPKELAAETFVEMDTDAQALLIRGFSDSELKEVIDGFTSTTRWISSKKCRQTSSRESSRRRTPRCASRSTKSCVTPRIPQARS